MKIFRKTLNRLRSAAARNRQRGAITITEALIVIGIGGTIVAGGIAMVPVLQNSLRVSDAQSGLSQIVVAVRGTFGARNSYQGLTTELAAGLAGFPRDFVSGTDVLHPWNEDVQIGPGDTTREFFIQFDSMESGPCASVATSTLDMAESVVIGSTTVDLDAVDDAATTAVDESEAANIAGLCTDGVNVRWNFAD